MQSLAILGRQPALGRAELESLYGAEVLSPINDQVIAIDLPVQDIAFARLGGTVKLCRILTILDTTDWTPVEDYLTQVAPAHAATLPEGKMQLGLSVYGLTVPLKQLQASGLNLKRVIKASGRSVRLVPNQELTLNSAQILHNHLTGPLGWELILVRYGQQTILAQTSAEQDITAYAKRDQARPKRDARIGMLPPKLAQIIINLASSQIDKGKGFRGQGLVKEDKPAASEAYTPNPIPSALTVLDPFCGTGVILQEALLMDFNAIGTDIDPRMVEYTHENILRWLIPSSTITAQVRIELGDATAMIWGKPVQNTFDVIASETYLGRPFNSLPTPEVLQKIINDVNTVLKKFLQNLTRQTKPSFRLCLAIPAWKTKGGFTRLPLLDSLDTLGYNRISFKHASTRDLIYHRENQVVGRELLVLTRV